MTTPNEQAPAPQAPAAPAPAAPAPGSAEYNAAMAAKANAKTESAEDTPPKGDAPLIGGKFKSTEDLLAAYQELEKKQGAPAPEKKPEGTKPADALKVEPEVQDVLMRAGLKQDDLAATFTKDGKLTDDQYKALAGAGIPKAMADMYLRGVAAEGDSIVRNVHAIVGGEKQFADVIGWAKLNADKAALNEYNAAIDSGDMGRITASLRAFQGAFNNANPQLIGGGAPTVTAGFRSDAEMIAAMADPRYAKDEAYRTDVYNKIAAMGKK